MEYLSWRLNFVLHLPLSLIILILLHKVPNDSESRLLEEFKFDKTGASLYMASIVLLCFGVSSPTQFKQPSTPKSLFNHSHTICESFSETLVSNLEFTNLQKQQNAD